MLRLLSLCVIAVSAFAQTSEVEHGQALYRSNCAFCHGLTGLGGRGPNLISGEHKTDAEVKHIISNGMPGSTMPAFDTLSDAQLDQLVAFIHHLAGSPVATETV